MDEAVPLISSVLVRGKRSRGCLLSSGSVQRRVGVLDTELFEGFFGRYYSFF